MADAAIQAGLSVPQLPDAAMERLRAALPVATGRNPVDSTANVGGRLHLFGAVGEAMVEGGDLGAMFFYLAHIGRNLERFPPAHESFAALRQRFPDVLTVAVMTHVDEIRRKLEAIGVPVFEDPTRAVRAVAGAAGLRALQAAARPRPEVAPGTGLVIEGTSEAAAKALLRKAGLPVPPERVCRDAGEAAAAAAEFGGTVAMKILSADIPHKTEIGGVLLDIAGADAASQGFATLVQRARAAKPDARLEGVLVAPMLKGGVETILGVQRDPVFGPMVMFGLGGVSVELFGDVAFASAPLSPEAADRLVGSVRGARLLEGFRGAAPVDRAALVDALCRLSAFAVAHQDRIEGIEVNPFLVRPDGAWALDALVAMRR
jgi:acyl-CoA synthetase (NDP forming)